ncbi:MAG: phosphoheptose isomerase [Bacteroidetes bacterium GWF2_38_335]|nr:MAG: phosphoheptose isomerase [Bacteroidetes bacterium GWF2_38_335]OFY77572.1 MAG: phosphoheptose isomerase [Bacteroidetes bacterium RIFOXYA12_FULL_38_20]HBS87127.1 D-sedoheptulose 7-phosphate isomerase [Bacteroidales bacterium]
MELIRKQFEEAGKTLETFMNDDNNIRSVMKAGDLIVDAISCGKKVISAGNGGSMCDAMHFAEEMTGRFRNDRHALPAIAISDPSFISCAANDFGYEKVFSRFIEGIGNNGDVFLAISTSGNSENIINAALKAREKGLKVIGLTGKDGGVLAGLCDTEVRAPGSAYADRAQEIHIKVIHTLILYVESKLNL